MQKGQKSLKQSRKILQDDKLEKEKNKIKVKMLMRQGNADTLIEYLTSTRTNFDMQASNYTVKLFNEHFNYSFMATMQSKRVFAGFAKLKSQLKDKPLPDITREELIYFVHDLRANAYYPDAFNIDLKSAYSNMLHKGGLINEETFDYIASMPKKERLACVGMLASRKENYVFKKGSPNYTGETVSVFAPFFYFAVKRTYEIMTELKKICGSDYLFTWVDGIYLKPDEDKLSMCLLYLDSIGFPYTVDYLKSFRVAMSETFVNVTFVKEGKSRYFNIPLATTEFQRLMSKYILSSNIKNKTNETGNIRIPKKSLR